MSASVAASRAPLRVALLGLGTVGRATAERLIDDAWRADVAGRGVVPVELCAVGVLDPHRPRGIELPASVRRTDRLDELVVDPSIDVIVEVIGGVPRPAVLVERALLAGKHVVTANKALLARLGSALEGAARASGTSLRFEAAVGGGIPLLAPLVRDLAANRVSSLRGIVNGTTNHIVSAMARDGVAYEAALETAQSMGYAEADATADVEGGDAADKLAILARLAFGGWPDIDHIRRAAPSVTGDARPGITPILPVELRGASELGLTLKLVAEARRLPDGRVAASVMPVAVRAAAPIGATDGVTNIVEVVGEPVGTVTFRGPGAGGRATSSAVLADLLALSRGEGSTWEPLPEPMAPLSVLDPLAGPKAWFLVATDAVGDGVAERLADISLGASDDAVVTHPLQLDQLRSLLRDRGVRATLYPLLSDE